MKLWKSYSKYVPNTQCGEIKNFVSLEKYFVKSIYSKAI